MSPWLPRVRKYWLSAIYKESRQLSGLMVVGSCGTQFKGTSPVMSSNLPHQVQLQLHCALSCHACLLSHISFFAS